ncbi:Zeta toxin [Cordyceps fumosorosea ARSEF 2679]|uniref:Zeta toxin n=1 Tax=Cordyceps fumosorosea (strain ARSEF 2679) TaxID=1081104 RepID=A0A168EIX8_CORFA|nr:Zeta toxin [Cordyceps fumosorosea ARSEF 2679]OAA73866.1 Zeta toxin [Cordyceps fumosorosea ARSEF 2679]
MEVRLIIISGRAGSGKTSTAHEMSEQLKRLEVRHAHIDGDNLDAVFPADAGSDMLLANLAALWSNYYHLRGVDRLIVSGTAAVLETERIVRTLRRVTASIPTLHFSASSSPPSPGGKDSPPRLGGKDGRMMPPASVTARAFILQVPDALAERRLRQREVGSELPALLAGSRRMAGVLESQVGGWARRVPTDQREVKEVAMDILRTAGWI